MVIEPLKNPQLILLGDPSLFTLSYYFFFIFFFFIKVEQKANMKYTNIFVTSGRDGHFSPTVLGDQNIIKKLTNCILCF